MQEALKVRKVFKYLRQPNLTPMFACLDFKLGLRECGTQRPVMDKCLRYEPLVFVLLL